MPLTEIETQQTGSAVSREETLSLTGSKVRETRLADKAAVSAARHDLAESAIGAALVTATGLVMVLAVAIAAISEIAAVVSEVATASAIAASVTAQQIAEPLVATAAAVQAAVLVAVRRAWGAVADPGEDLVAVVAEVVVAVAAAAVDAGDK